MLKRGAVLHADIAMLDEGQSCTPEPSRPTAASSSILVSLADGQQTGVEDASVHWEMGRRLLDKIRPKGTRKLGADPGSDETVRLWYLAANVYMQAVEQLDAWHVDRSVQLFPRIPEMLFFAACAREMFSGPTDSERAAIDDAGPRSIQLDRLRRRRAPQRRRGSFGKSSSATPSDPKLGSDWAASSDDEDAIRRRSSSCDRRAMERRIGCCGLRDTCFSARGRTRSV